MAKAEVPFAFSSSQYGDRKQSESLPLDRLCGHHLLDVGGYLYDHHATHGLQLHLQRAPTSHE